MMTNQAYEKQQILDRLTRQDELMIRVNESLIQLLAAIKGITPGQAGILTQYYQVPNQNELLNAQVVPYRIKELSMTAAAADFAVTEQGTYFVAASDGSLKDVYVKYNNPSNDRSPLNYFNWQIPFYKLFFTWPAQANKKLYIAIGLKGIAAPEVRPAQASLVTPGQEVLYNAMPAGIGTYFSTMFNFAAAKRLVLYVSNQLDVDVTVQPIGNIEDSTATASVIDGVIPVASTEYASVGLDADGGDWHPFIGMQIVTTVAPTAGLLTITAVPQE